MVCWLDRLGWVGWLTVLKCWLGWMVGRLGWLVNHLVCWLAHCFRRDVF